MAEEIYEQVQLEKLRISSKKDEELSIPHRKVISQTENNSLINNEPIFSFDQLLTVIGFGKYQFYIYLIMALLGITEGAQITLFTLMIPILKKEWNVPDTLNSLQASCIFVGFLTGSMLSGQFSDRLGRRGPFLYSSFLTTFVTLLSIFCQDIYQLLFIRAIMGILVGFFAPCGVTMLSEITQIDLRGRYMSLITLTFAIGQMYGIGMAGFFLTTLEEGNWRAMTFFSALPGVLAWIICVLRLQESARFLLLMGRKDEAFIILQNMIEDNRSTFELNTDIKSQIMNWVTQMNKIAKSQQNASLTSLFQQNRLIVTCLIWFNWFTLSFMYYGIIMMLPTFLTKLNLNDNYFNQNKLLQLFLSAISDVLGAFAASLFIDLKHFGRKNSLILFFFVQSLSSLMTYYDDNERFILWATLCKFFLSMTFIFSFQYTAEIYPTKIRTTGVGMANGIGRLGGVVMPWICLYLSSIDLLSPFLLFAGIRYYYLGISMLTSLSNICLPYDTMGKEIE